MSVDYDIYSDAFLNGSAPGYLYRAWAKLMAWLYGQGWKGWKRDFQPKVSNNIPINSWDLKTRWSQIWTFILSWGNLTFDSASANSKRFCCDRNKLDDEKNLVTSCQLTFAGILENAPAYLCRQILNLRYCLLVQKVFFQLVIDWLPPKFIFYGGYFGRPRAKS